MESYCIKSKCVENCSSPICAVESLGMERNGRQICCMETHCITKLCMGCACSDRVHMELGTLLHCLLLVAHGHIPH